MKITNIKINGIRNPVGYGFHTLNLSYTVDFAPKFLLLQLAYEKDFTTVIYEQKLNFKQSFCTPIHFTPQKETRYYIRIVSGKATCEEAYFETGTEFDCRFITPRENFQNPVLCKKFHADGEVEWARLYITGLGLYEAYVNGIKAGNEHLTPNCNDYDSYLQYQTYDITNSVNHENEIEIYLGNGWYKGRFGLTHSENIYGDKYVAAAKIVLKLKDGRRQTIETDESWSAKSSPILSGNIYDGEICDMTAEIKTTSVSFSDKKFHVVPRISLPVVVKEKLIPELYISPKGERILDFKQNFAGYVSFDIPLKKGQTIRLQVGEVLQNDCFYRDNLRSAKAEYVYISDGQRRGVRPKFTFYGFRYLLVEGLSEIDPKDFTGNVIYSDLDRTVSISTDNSKINRLLQNCLWGQKSNFIDVPTDCPQRDERLGWTGDAEVFSKTACYQMDCKAFFNKYLTDVAIDQNIYGGITTYSPAMKEGELAASVWADAAAIIPWNVYTMYGDKSFLSEHFPMMERYANDVLSELNKHGSPLCRYGFHLGDWLSQDGITAGALKAETDEYFIASAYYYNSINLTAQSAKVLGYREQYQKYSKAAKEIRRAILKEYFTSSGKLSVDTQTGYVLCVNFGIYQNKARLVQDFQRRMEKDCYKVKGGFVGAPQLVQALISCGLIEDAFRVLYSENYPGWLACVNLGATTIWERWNSLNEDGSVSGTGMNSFNHYSFGAVAEAFYAYIAGLRPLTAGFKKAVIQPSFNYRLKQLDYGFLSVSGEYGVHYRLQKGNTVKLKIKVPFGAQAILKLEGEPDRILIGGVHEIEYLPHTNLEYPFSEDSKLCDLLSDCSAAEVLKQTVPGYYYFLTGTEVGFSGMRLADFASLRSFRIPKEKLTLLGERLKQICIF